MRKPNRRRRSSPLIRAKSGKTIAERLAYHSYLDPETGCRIWKGSKDGWGYGEMWDGKKKQRAHRLAWIEHTGGVPIGYAVCHTCDNPACINPDHLWLGTGEENDLDKLAKGRQWRPPPEYPIWFKKGEDHQSAKLTAEKARAIFLDPRFPTALASVYGVRRQNIERIQKGNLWREATAGLVAPLRSKHRKVRP